MRAASTALERVIHCRKYDPVRLARYSTSAEIVFPGVETNGRRSVGATSDSVAGRFLRAFASSQIHSPKLSRTNRGVILSGDSASSLAFQQTLRDTLVVSSQSVVVDAQGLC